MSAQPGRARLQVGLVGLGRLGRVYARDLATRLAGTRLVAVADPDAAAAAAVASEFGVPRTYPNAQDLAGDPQVEAVVVVSPTHTHRDVVVEAAARRKPIFCEKPPALSLRACGEMRDAVERHGVFFQMGLMRRFDPGYAAARRHLDEGRLGRPVLFKSSSRDPFRTSLEFARPSSSGGMLVDMGIHDFDLARWFMGEVATVSAVGGVLAYPELATVGDIDNAVATLVFADGRLGVVDLTRNACYGYDIVTELLGTEGTIRIGYLRETPVTLLTKNTVAHDTVPYFMQRFEQAYTRQLDDFAQNVLAGREPPVTLDDGIAALRVALAATRAYHTGAPVRVSDVVD